MKDSTPPDGWELDLTDWQMPEDWPPLAELEDWQAVEDWPAVRQLCTFNSVKAELRK